MMERVLEENGVKFTLTKKAFNGDYDGNLAFTITDGAKVYSFEAKYSSDEWEGVTSSSDSSLYFQGELIYSAWGGMEQKSGSKEYPALQEARNILCHYLVMFGEAEDNNGLLKLVKSVDPSVRYIPVGFYEWK